jgi:hypothetical protein
MNRRAFVSINRMREGHASLKATTAECKRVDGLQTEERTRAKGQQ